MSVLVGKMRVIGLVVSFKALGPSNDHAELRSQLEYSSSVKAPKKKKKTLVSRNHTVVENQTLSNSPDIGEVG